MPFLLIILSLLTTFMMQGCGGGNAEATPVVSEKIHVSALGDSITQAFFCDYSPGSAECVPRAVQQKAWPAKLASINSSLDVSSYAAAGCQIAACPYQVGMSLWFKPDYVVMLFGVNEAVRGVPTSTFIIQLQSAIAQQPKARHVLVKPPVSFPISVDLDARTMSLLKEYRAALDALADPDVIVVDPLSTKEWWCDIRKDQHPCEEAQTAIANAVSIAIGN